MIYDPEDQKRLVMQNICLKNLVQRNIEDTLLSIHVVGISMGAVYKMLTNWPRIQTDFFKMNISITEWETESLPWFKCEKKIIKLLKRKKNRLFSDINVVTEDEKWLHYFQPQRKLNNTAWMTKHGKHPLIAKRFQITKKFSMLISLMGSCCVAISYSQEEEDCY